MSEHNFEIGDKVSGVRNGSRVWYGTVTTLCGHGIECWEQDFRVYIYIPNHMLYTLTNITKQQKATQDNQFTTSEQESKEQQMKEQNIKPKNIKPEDKVELTPCEQLGYKVGDKFIVLRTTGGFTKNQTVILYEDDHTNRPLFKGSNTRYTLCEEEEGAFLGLEDVELFKELKTDKGENEMTEQTTKSNEPKNKPKTQVQLVFTHTNGKKYIVRGLQQVKVFLNGSKFQVDYTHATYDGAKHQTSSVSVYVTNELVKVEKINTDNSVEVVLDLSNASVKAVEGAKKPRGNARSKEEYEAMLEAKKSQEERNKALVEAKARELAETMFKEGKI